jgi:hypothetical protein
VDEDDGDNAWSVGSSDTTQCTPKLALEDSEPEEEAKSEALVPVKVEEVEEQKLAKAPVVTLMPARAVAARNTLSSGGSSARALPPPPLQKATLGHKSFW